MDTKDKKLTSLRLNKNLYKHLQEKAKEENRSLNNYIETLLLDASEYKVPNEITFAAMKEFEESRENLDVISSKEELRKYLSDLLNE